MSAQTWLNRVWYSDAPPPWWLKVPAALYGGVLRVRQLLYRQGYRRRVRLQRPVIVVGNVSVGGTGKTPLVCWLAQQLSQLGLTPGIVLRGYGGSAREPQLVQHKDNASLVGDEAVLLQRRSGATVAVGRDRPAAAALLVAAGCDVILADDGLQHYALERDCEIAVVDATRQFGNGYLLPAGPLREPKQRLSGVQAIIVNGGDPHVTVAPSFAMRLSGTNAVAFASGESRPLAGFAGQKVHALAGIGNPQRFFDLLTDSGIEVIPHPLPDHAVLSAAEVNFGDGRAVLMTEKDAVKCAAFASAQHWYVPVSAQFEPAAAKALLAIVQKAADSFRAA